METSFREGVLSNGRLPVALKISYNLQASHLACWAGREIHQSKTSWVWVTGQWGILELGVAPHTEEQGPSSDVLYESPETLC